MNKTDCLLAIVLELQGRQVVRAELGRESTENFNILSGALLSFGTAECEPAYTAVRKDATRRLF
ncbi:MULTISPECIES: hypothetical protein [unclassified Paenibacillus]|uniref:hypothetical protein n=1 Tax=unclassified Paenibacillus TaxID=185978 RepID=UPI002405A010|nr:MULTISPECIES: hypothetical protein [unclassified Paenibacillus]MDF9841753.1 hypothetical protein [Paenibacillus sp. PastF-2]MDF9848135.1 hypothetical protein [Paenibacillus sp. PastM-2]MDF9854912.1 hypothetical protein [Paenibacillus sp. PastF-1]MDH6480182.1 hypothetical protein [Paenibacillus sp. PastH-2]MDH6507612.1 hypothetical protein [Paenibacillus sp. PastM-3]